MLNTSNEENRDNYFDENKVIIGNLFLSYNKAKKIIQ